MTKITFLKLLFAALCLLIMQSCGSVIVSGGAYVPTPPWFYPNRVEVVRYVYFPDHLIYYDLHLKKYIYFDNNTWISVSVLPTRFNHIDLRKSRFHRIKNYYGDNIKKYHNQHQKNKRDRPTTRRRNN